MRGDRPRHQRLACPQADRNWRTSGLPAFLDQPAPPPIGRSSPKHMLNRPHVRYNRVRAPQSKLVSHAISIGYGFAGWGGRIRTSAWWNQNPLPYHLATPQKLSGKRRDDSRADSLWQRPVYSPRGAISTADFGPRIGRQRS